MKENQLFTSGDATAPPLKSTLSSGLTEVSITFGNDDDTELPSLADVAALFFDASSAPAVFPSCFETSVLGERSGSVAGPLAFVVGSAH